MCVESLIPIAGGLRRRRTTKKSTTAKKTTTRRRRTTKKWERQWAEVRPTGAEVKTSFHCKVSELSLPLVSEDLLFFSNETGPTRTVSETLFKAVLLSLIIYIIITSVYEWQFNDNIIRSYTILKSDIESKLNLGADGIITFTSDPYYEGKQLKIFSNLQHSPEIIDHALTCLHATL